MIKTFSFRKALFAPAMLLLCGIFMQSCTEKMPILQPLNGSSNNGSSNSITVSSKSTISLNFNNTANTITNISPSTILFSTMPGGASLPLLKSYIVAGNNGSKTSNILYGISFHTDTIGNNKFIFDSSQLVLNKKTYTTFNLSGKVKFTIDKLDDTANTASGSFSYYVYDDIVTPTDSIYVSGSFNIVK